MIRKLDSIENLEEEVKEIIEILKPVENITKNVQKKLIELGYVKTKLGTGKSAYTYSTKLSIMEVKSHKYANGKYLVIGIYKKHDIYRGFVKPCDLSEDVAILNGIINFKKKIEEQLEPGLDDIDKLLLYPEMLY